MFLWSNKKYNNNHGLELEQGMGNFRINPDFWIENFHFKQDISVLHLFTRPSFYVK